MTATPDIRPVGDLPDGIGKTAARELSLNGITSLQQVAEHSKKELLAIHGVGPKAVAILGVSLRGTSTSKGPEDQSGFPGAIGARHIGQTSGPPGSLIAPMVSKPWRWYSRRFCGLVASR